MPLVAESAAIARWVLDQRRRSGMRGAALSAVPDIFGERHELALAANSGTMLKGILPILLDNGSG
eukprot:7654989-Pyramimonas_sp.AAC.1